MRKLFQFYFSSRGTVSARGYMLGMVLPGIVLFIAIMVLVQLKISPVWITWPVILFTLATGVLGKPVTAKRDRDAGRDPRVRRKHEWAMLGAVVLVVGSYLAMQMSLLAILPFAAGFAWLVWLAVKRMCALMAPKPRD